MDTSVLAHKLIFIQTRRQKSEAALLAEAMQEGIQKLYRESLIEAYLLEQIPREQILKEIGQKALDAIDFQRDAIQKDIAWGLEGA